MQEESGLCRPIHYFMLTQNGCISKFQFIDRIEISEVMLN